MARALLLAQAPAQHRGGAYRDMINQVVPAGQPKIVFSFSSILQRPPPSHHHHQRGSFQVLTKQHCSLQKKVSAILLRKVAVEVQTTERRKGICSVADVAEQGVQTDHKDVLVHQTHSQSFQNIHSESGQFDMQQLTIALLTYCSFVCDLCCHTLYCWDNLLLCYMQFFVQLCSHTIQQGLWCRAVEGDPE
jgi:hypothetical protein